MVLVSLCDWLVGGGGAGLLLLNLQVFFYCDIKCTKNWTNQRQQGRTLNRG